MRRCTVACRIGRFPNKQWILARPDGPFAGNPEKRLACSWRSAYRATAGKAQWTRRRAIKRLPVAAPRSAKLTVVTRGPRCTFSFVRRPMSGWFDHPFVCNSISLLGELRKLCKPHAIVRGRHRGSRDHRGNKIAFSGGKPQKMPVYINHYKCSDEASSIAPKVHAGRWLYFLPPPHIFHGKYDDPVRALFFRHLERVGYQGAIGSSRCSRSVFSAYSVRNAPRA